MKAEVLYPRSNRAICQSQLSEIKNQRIISTQYSSSLSFLKAIINIKYYKMSNL